MVYELKQFNSLAPNVVVNDQKKLNVHILHISLVFFFYYFLGRQILAYVLGENKAIWKSFQQLTLIESRFFRIFAKLIHFEDIHFSIYGDKNFF